MLSIVVSIFLSSFLLFQIQPLLGKYILPWFGGTSNVWSVSMLFYQLVLTAGYAYANWLAKNFSQKRQGGVHLVIVGLTVFVMGVNFFYGKSPILPEVSRQPQVFSQPVANLLKILLLSIGLPYFLLSTNSSLLQTWYTNKNPGSSPYRLYAVSNLGSLVGLLTYPIFMEPFFSLHHQSVIWSTIYIIFVTLISIQSWTKWRNRDQIAESIDHSGLKHGIQNLDWNTSIVWVLLAALGSILMLSTTSLITQEIAPIPFLWVAPLCVYLISFILTFSNERWYNRALFGSLLFVLTIFYLWFILGSAVGLVTQVIIYTLLLFVSLMICHGELYQSRPSSAQLTSFYLFVSVGGALGGLAVNLLFPKIFTGYWEFQVCLIAIWCLLLIYVLQFPFRFAIIGRIVVGCAVIMTCLVIISLYLQTSRYNQDAVLSSRNFFGIVSIKEKSINDPVEHRYVLTHGITTHGYQFTLPVKKQLPTAYYTEKSGVGIGLLHHPSRPGPLRIGVIGLGVGVIASYGQEGDEIVFYEINPTVVEIANSEYFSYISASQAEIEILNGDGRILLENELDRDGSNDFDFLVVDAFNSDSIPTHLLTAEAFELYLKHIKPDGILALHISNQYLNLRPVVLQLADRMGLKGVTIYNTAKDVRIKPSLWVLLTNNQNFLNNPEAIKYTLPEGDEIANQRMWTDDYSNLIQILK